MDPDARPDPHDLPDGLTQPDIFDALADLGAHPVPERRTLSAADRHRRALPRAAADAGAQWLADRRPQPDRDRAAGRGSGACPEPLCDLHPGGPGRHVVTCPRADLDTLRDAVRAAWHDANQDPGPYPASHWAVVSDLFRRINTHPDR